MINSKAKGSAFERKIVNLLKEFVKNNNANVHISRNFEQNFKQGQCDINFLNYAIECKFYKEGDMYKKEWWKQVCDSAEERIPVLVFKFNRRPIRVVLPFWAIMPNIEKNNEKVLICLWEHFLDIVKENKILKAYANT